MNKLERQFAKRLEELENDFLTRYKVYLDRVIYLPHVYDARQVATMQLPLPGTLARLLRDYAHEVFAIGQAHGDLLCRELHKKYASHKLAYWQPSFQLAGGIGYDAETFWLKPEAALKSLESRAILLAGDVEQDILSGVKKITLDHLHGTPRPETEQALAKLLDDNINRARLVTTTETTYDYNRGRLSSFHANGVDYVRFSAVMDARTSAQCRSRHGKIMRLDSPDLAGNIPPLHGRCRSVLQPIYSSYQPELLTNEALDWNKVVPLPKGWITDSNTGKPAAVETKVSVSLSKAEKEIQRLLNNAPLHDRRKLAQHLLQESEIKCPIHVKQLRENGSFRWVGKSGDVVSPHDFNLKSDDGRPERYRLKTVFHEVTHARMSGAKIEYNRVGFERWLSMEETTAETVAHYITKVAGIQEEIAPSYSRYLVNNLPRLKQLPEFTDCKTIGDFGRVLAKYRYDMRAADWGNLIERLDHTELDMVEYSKYYKDYVRDNVDSIVEALGDSSGLSPLSKDSHFYIKNLIIKAWDRMDVNHQAFKDSLIIAMNRLGVN